jgi:hypothetical protein
MGKTRESWTIWVCTNCIMHAANGECGDCHRDEGHEGGEPLSRLSPEACPGMGREDHDDACAVKCMCTHGDDCEEHGDDSRAHHDPSDHVYPDDYECDCETNTFSMSDCQGCGSEYHGERHAMTEWGA